MKMNPKPISSGGAHRSKLKRIKENNNVFDAFLRNPKNSKLDPLNYKDLGAFDDILTECFIDKVCILYDELPSHQHIL